MGDFSARLELLASAIAGTEADGGRALEVVNEYRFLEVEEVGICELSSVRSAATPRSPSRTVPSSSMRRLAALTSRWMNPLVCR